MTTSTTTVTTAAISVRQFYGDMSSSSRYGDDFSRGGGLPAPRRPTVAQTYHNDPKRLCFAIAARNRRYAEQTMARLIEIQWQRALNDKELEQWSKAERWIFDESEYYSRVVEQLLVG